MSKISKQLKKISDKYYAQLDKILSHYSCPVECGGACCRYSGVRFTREEYPKILQNIDVVSRQLIETNVVEIPSDTKEKLLYLEEYGYELNLTMSH
jgi:hypothetical protein